MCGITGLYAFNLVGRMHVVNLANATLALESRGPDFQDMYHDEHVGLGHRRLSIIDTSNQGHQPMTDPSGRYMIIFNGEIYNYKTLRKNLEASGVNFRSETDTEVLLQAYIHQGKACLQDLQGFFSFAIYDKKEERLFLARDRFGIKPLYYLIDGDKLLFASEMKAMIPYGISKEIDMEALYTYLQLNYIPAPLTIFKQVKKLLPGHCIEISTEEFTVSKYYNPETPEFETTDRENLKKTLQEKLEAAVHKRLVADVPLGSFLSGGIDSSIIAALAVQQKPDLRTFSIGFKDQKYFDESEHANAVARHLGTNHQTFSLSTKDLYNEVHHVLDYIDEPFADSSAIAVYLLSKVTRNEVTVALSGDGADELFGGYNKHRAFHRSIHPGIFEKMVGGMGPLWYMMPKSRHSPFSDKFRKLYRFSKGMNMSARDRYWAWAGFASEQEVKKLIRADFGNENYTTFKEEWLEPLLHPDPMNGVLDTDIGLVLPNDMLTKVDLMSMAHGLEVRVPFLDHDLVEWVRALPSEYKVNRHSGKLLLKETFKSLLPESIHKRPKHGFEVPLRHWLTHEMKSLVFDDLLSKTTITQQGIFNYQEINALKRKLFSLNPGDAHARIWALVVFQWWWRRFGQ